MTLFSEEALRTAAKEVSLALVDSVQEPEKCQHIFSLGFERKMARLLRRARHPVLTRILRSVACVALIAALSFATLMATNAQAREWVLRWVMEWHPTHVSFNAIESAESDELKHWEPSWLPEGYSRTGLDVEGGLVVAVYESEYNDLPIYLQYMPMQEDMGFNVDNEWHTITNITINNMPGQRFDSDRGETNMVLWFDNENQYSFLLSGHIDTETLIAVAESVCLLDAEFSESDRMKCW